MKYFIIKINERKGNNPGKYYEEKRNNSLPSKISLRSENYSMASYHINN